MATLGPQREALLIFSNSLLARDNVKRPPGREPGFVQLMKKLQIGALHV